MIATESVKPSLLVTKAPCTRCRVNIPAGDYRTCVVCREYVAEATKWRIRNGYCTCKKPLEPGKQNCKECQERYNQSARDNAKTRAFSGECEHCSRKISKNQRMCRLCKAKKKKYGKASIRRRKKRGLCLRCTNKAQVKIKVSKTGRVYKRKSVYCEDCAARNRARREAWDPDGSKQAKYLRERREKLLADGLCTCGHHKVEEGKTRCKDCLETNRITQAVSNLKKRTAKHVQERTQPPRSKAAELDRMVALLGGKLPEEAGLLR